MPRRKKCAGVRRHVTVGTVLLAASLGGAGSGHAQIIPPLPSLAPPPAQVVEESAPETVRAQSQVVVTAVLNRLSVLRPQAGAFTLAPPPVPAGGPPTPQVPGTNVPGGITGLAGGDTPGGRWSVWSDVSVTLLDNDTPDFGFAGNAKSALAGVDWVAIPSLVVGAAVGYEGLSQVGRGLSSDRLADGGTAVAYAGYILQDWLIFTAQAGFNAATNEFRGIGAGGIDVRGDYRSRRYLLNGTFQGFHTAGAWTLTGSAGFLRAVEIFDSYRTSAGDVVDPDRTYLGQFTFGLEIARRFGPVEAYAGSSYDWDTVTSSGEDPNGGLVTGGLRYQVTGALSAGLLGSVQYARRDDTPYTIGANLRFAF